MAWRNPPVKEPYRKLGEMPRKDAADQNRSRSSYSKIMLVNVTADAVSGVKA